MTSVYDAHDDYASSSSASRPVSSYSHHDDGDDEDPWAVPQQRSMRHSWAPPPDDDEDSDQEQEEQEPQRRRESSEGTIVGKKQAAQQASPPTPTSPLSEAAPSSPPTTSRDPWNRGSEARGVRSPTHGLSTTNSTFRGGFTDANGSGNIAAAAAAAAASSPTLPPAAATPWDGQRISVRLRPELEGFVFKHNAYNVRRTAVLPPQTHSSGAASCDALLSQARNRRGAANGSRNGATAASLSALPQPEAPSSPSSCVVRRYSDFVWLHDVLLKRWPLRLIPPLPPKRLGMPLVAGAASLGGSAADDAFIQRRARGLERYLAALMTHPIVSHDAHLAVFLSDKGSIADWRASHSNPAIVEETMDPRSPSNVNGSRLSQQHQAVPKGFDDATGGKSLDALTNKVVPVLLDKWTNLTNVVERMARRHEAQARDSDALAGLIEDVNVSSRSGASWAWLGGRRRSNDEGQPGSGATEAQPAATRRIASLHRDLSSLSLLRARQTLGAREQADQLRSQDSSSRDSNDDSATVSPTLPLLERFKMMRDLFLALRSLLARHASLAKQLDDEVSILKARIKAGNARLESLRLGNATAATSAEAAREEATKLHEALRRDASRADEVAVRRERARRALWDEVGLVRARCTEPAIAAVWAGGGAGVAAGVDSGTSWLEDERKLRGAERLAVEECWRDLRLRDG